MMAHIFIIKGFAPSSARKCILRLAEKLADKILFLPRIPESYLNLSGILSRGEIATYWAKECRLDKAER